MEELREFLGNHECHMYTDKNKKVQAFMCVDFSELSNFVELMGPSYFDDSCVSVIMKNKYIVVNVLEILEGTGHGLIDIKECFSTEDWNDCYKFY